MAADKYEDRYCAYVDILGFKEFVNRLDSGRSSFELLKDLLTKLHNPPKLLSASTSYPEADFQVQSMSDAVVISTAPTAWGLLNMIESLNQLTTDLLFDGYFIRGAIVKGNLYHDEKMVFGNALVKAFQLEQAIVDYPRIMVMSDIADDAQHDDNYGMFIRDRVRQADDGPWFIHSLNNLEKFLKINPVMPKSGSAAHQELDYWITIQIELERNFIKSADTPRHFQKAKWFADYWNRTVDPIGEKIVMHVEGPGLASYYPAFFDNSIPSR